ncbi:nicotinate (nicotinamide) nucleotide adenylyltransferase [Verrucomicrobia bacterium LW23]|nr:nicotinate (nicotinamide) nucleotide adenylyltransferase [Verrucomicrobia bacterium LW23]
MPPPLDAPPQRPRRIALYGGTFDPVHHAHLIVAQDALEQLHLDVVLFVPAYRSPFKAGVAATDGEHRLAMLRLATDNHPGFGVLDCEIAKAVPSYAIDTVEDVRAANPGAELFFLIGEDHALTLDRWHRWLDLRAMVTFVMQTRHRFESPQGSGTSNVPAEQSAADAMALIEPYLIRLPNSRHVDISASEIRRRVAEGRSIHYLVPPAVADYIAAHGLYTGGIIARP